MDYQSKHAVIALDAVDDGLALASEINGNIPLVHCHPPARSSLLAFVDARYGMDLSNLSTLQVTLDPFGRVIF